MKIQPIITRPTSSRKSCHAAAKPSVRDSSAVDDGICVASTVMDPPPFKRTKQLPATAAHGLRCAPFTREQTLIHRELHSHGEAPAMTPCGRLR
jgi:hypothetical protein